jgi:hypothetical protein
MNTVQIILLSACAGGLFLGRFFDVFVLFCASLCTIVLVAVKGVDLGFPAWKIAGLCVLVVLVLQISYFLVLGVRSILERLHEKKTTRLRQGQFS